MSYIIAGTGSRSLQVVSPDRKELVWNWLVTEIMAAKLAHDDLAIMSGMAEGFDKALAMAALDQGIPLICVVPNKGYGDYYWRRNSLTNEDRYHEFQAIIASAAEVEYVMEDVYKSTSLYLNGKHSNFVRNDRMVELADEFWVYSPTSSGTRQCLQSIIKSEKPYQIVEVV